MKRRIFALLFVSLTLVTMGVGVFAQQPNIKNPANDYLDIYQNRPQNEGVTSSWFLDLCPDCGKEVYSITLSGYSPDDGDIISIINSAESVTKNTFADTGILTNQSHTATEHTYGFIYYTPDSATSFTAYTSLEKSIDIFYCNYQIIPYTSPVYPTMASFYDNYIIGGQRNYIRSYAVVNICVPYYTDEFLALYSQDYYSQGFNTGYNTGLTDGYDSAYADGYADGQINGQENMDAIDYVGVLIDGVAQPIISACSQLSFFGVSVLTLIGLVVSVTLIMTIIKIIRG